MVEPYPRAYNDSMWIDIFYSAHKQRAAFREVARNQGFAGTSSRQTFSPE